MESPSTNQEQRNEIRLMLDEVISGFERLRTDFITMITQEEQNDASLISSEVISDLRMLRVYLSDEGEQDREEQDREEQDREEQDREEQDKQDKTEEPRSQNTSTDQDSASLTRLDSCHLDIFREILTMVKRDLYERLAEQDTWMLEKGVNK